MDQIGGILIRNYTLVLILAILFVISAQEVNAFGNITSNDTTEANESDRFFSNSEMKDRSIEQCDSCLSNIINGSAKLSVVTACNPTKAGEAQIDITIANEGEIALEGIRLNSTLLNGTKFENSLYLNLDIDLNYPTRIENDNATTKFLSWFLGDMQTAQEKKLRLLVSYSKEKEFSCSQVKVHASAYAVGERIESIDGIRG
jgi:hypothetical protein